MHIPQLKPCPFCGGKAEYQQFANPQNFFKVKCTVCDCSTDGFRHNHVQGTDIENKTLNSEIWNRRVVDGDNKTKGVTIDELPEFLT